MRDAVFAVLVFEAEIHAAGLVVAKAGAARYFEVTALSGGPDLDVVGFGGAEADVAGAEFDDAVVQAEELEHFFRVAGQRLQFGHAGLWRGDFHELDLVELMHANEAARAEACAAGFTTEAGCVSGVIDRQLLVRHDFFAMQIRHGHLGGRDEVKIVLGAVIHLIAEFRKLAGADEAIRFHQQRRADLLIAMLRRVQVEEEIDERTLQAGTGTFVNDEGAAGDFHAGFEVDHAERSSDGGVVLRFEGELRLRAPATHFGVLLGAVADGAGFVRQIGDAEKQIALLHIAGVGFAADFIDAAADAAHLGLDGAGVLAVFLGDADLLADAVAVALQLLALGFGAAALGVDFEHLIDEGSMVAATVGEALFHRFGIFAQQSDIEHKGAETSGRVWLVECGKAALTGRGAGRSLRAHFPTMRSLTLTAPHTFEWTTLPPAGAPGAGQVKVRIRAIGICGTDFSGYQGKMPFIEFPRILGHELGVEVLEVGPGVSHLRAGDRCSVEPYLNCGQCHACARGCTNCCETLAVLGVHCDGGMREEMILPAAKLHACNALAFEQLALVETLAIGCHAVNRAAVTASDDVLVIGAGPIGLTVIEFVRAAGARMTVLEMHARRRDFVREHYAGVEVVERLPEEFRAQVIFDATGNARSMSSATSWARFTGRVVYVGITKEPVTLDDPLFHRRELTLLASRNAQSPDFPRILGMIEAGVIDTRPWISHRCVFGELPDQMPVWLKPETGVIKAVVGLD